MGSMTRIAVVLGALFYQGKPWALLNDAGTQGFGRSEGRYYVRTTPAMGLEAAAYSRLGMRPAR